ncbi:DUF1642 domain-containing protein [Listeria booriae]|uniref:DUF1642 domain-containing protein n=1 Tax=Listeria booriae TaxID=1552123 RepID=UPI001624212C|nr:DUF1642 domain-containing protein [Listeria booriae]MBC1801015.1 DUF1642 domain-containing protein [Listeria booriae]
MTNKFKVGDRVQFVAGNKHRLGVIVSEKNKNSYIVEDDHDTYIIHKNRVAPAPALVVAPHRVASVIKLELQKRLNRENALIVLLEYFYDACAEHGEDSFEKGSVNRWICDNFTQFISAVLYGYTVEKEPLYYVRLPHFGYVTNRMDYTLSQSKTDAIALTESRIKAIDERYWQFAVPVEEVGGYE